jgi:uncharacterized membrane protein
MTDQNCAAPFRIDKRSIGAVAAGMLIGMGLVLQWIELVFTHVAERNTWFFAILFEQTWNMINIWLTAAWDGDLRYWPLLLVITGAVILVSLGPKRSSQ